MIDNPTPDCPGCGHPPHIAFDDGRQSMCGNDDCQVLMWDATLTRDQLAADSHHVDWTWPKP